jgi:hypothetical protein
LRLVEINDEPWAKISLRGPLMNKSQRLISGWASMLIGLAIVVGGVLNLPSFRIDWQLDARANRYKNVFDIGHFLKELLVSPPFYIGLVLLIVGIVILKGRKQ